VGDVGRVGEPACALGYLGRGKTTVDGETRDGTVETSDAIVQPAELRGLDGQCEYEYAGWSSP
jgi:hypothetical protein